MSALDTKSCIFAQKESPQVTASFLAQMSSETLARPCLVPPGPAEHRHT